MYPKRIVCLTEESVETLFLLGEGARIVGVSNYVVRPKEATELPKVSLFTNSQYEKIEALKPDLILGFSDIQKDIAQELIGRGHNVFISNHRSLEEIFEYIARLAGMIGRQQKGEELIVKLRTHLESFKSESRGIKVYFEEWDGPQISAIRWVSDLIEWCGGSNIFPDQANSSLAKDRIVQSEDVIQANPDIIFGCWCGKKVKTEKIKSRPGWEKIEAVKKDRVYELDPAIFLQPGPAPILEGAKLLQQYFSL